MSPARRGLLIFLPTLIFLTGALAYHYVRPGATASGASIGGPFTLTDQNGVSRSDHDFRGKLMLVYFGFTFCPDECPAALQTMSQALDRLGSKADDVAPLFISVDPDRDTVPVMKTYAANFHPSLIALTGSREAVAEAKQGYGIYAAKGKSVGNADYTIVHSSIIFLMGRDGHYLTHFGSDTNADSLAAAITAAR